MTRHATPQELFDRFTDQKGECLEWIGDHDVNGYGRIMIAGKRWTAHRLSWFLNHGPIPDGLMVRHKCDNPPCCLIDHLELGTHRDNMDDRIKRKTGPRGTAVHTAKLDESKVRELVAGLDAGLGIRETARLFGISHTAVRHIAIGKNWSHISGRRS